MRVFYTAKSFSGETKSGEMVVKDERDLAMQLRVDDFILTSFKKMDEDVSGSEVKVSFLDRFTSIPISEKMMLARNLSVMISSGLPLSRAVKNITNQTENKSFAKILGKILENLQAGNTFADCLAKYPGIFDELFVNMVRVGEATGNLEEVLDILAGQLEKEHELLSKVKGAMMYPAVIIVAMIGIGILMMIYVVPQITGVFKDLNADLPATTKFIIASSTALREHSVLVFVGFFVVGVLAKLSLMTAIGKKILSFIAIRMPVVKDIIIKVNCARFSRIYSSLLKSGVPIIEALNILSRTLTNFYYKNALLKAVDSIQKGVNLSKVFYEEKMIFPVMVPQMIEVGEETGKTETILLKLAEFYEKEVDQRTKNMSSIIEPVLMIFIGGAVGFFAISILQPMYSVLGSIK
jgi:type IV pilus assembly protein PilC